MNEVKVKKHELLSALKSNLSHHRDDIEENITIERKVRVDMYSSCQLFTFYVPKKEESI